MKRFVIKNPIPGRTTAALVTHEYNKSTQRTQSIYLGCISIEMDPAKLNDVKIINAGQTFFGVKLRPGMFAAGSAFRLEAEDVRTVQGWLVRNGIFVKEEEARKVAIAAERSAAAAQHAALVSEVETALRNRLEGQWHAEFLAQRSVAAGSALDRAVSALGEAGLKVMAEAHRMREEGNRLTSRRKGSTAKRQTTALDKLFNDSVALRTKAFSEFEECCKSSGLMICRTSRRTPKT